jgi:recombinational DNA repair protein (RecF pathway)
MPICTKCKTSIQDEGIKNHHGEILCEDCYIDEVVPKMPKAHYDNEAEFMNRLKDSYSVRRQQYH